MYTELKFGKEAKDKMFIGLEKVYRAVSSTLGKYGKNVVYRSFGIPKITNDGVSVARQIALKDPFEAMGADLVKQASEKTNEEAGDGTTTACILSYALVKEGRDNKNPVLLRKELERASEEVIKELGSMSTKIESDEKLLEIASISVEDKEIAKTVVEAVRKAGETGRVVVEESGAVSIGKEEIQGLEFEGGYATPYMISTDKGESVVEDCPVLITDKKFSLNRDIIGIMDAVNKSGQKNLFIVCQKLEAEALQTIIANRIKGIFFTCAVAVAKDKETLEDLAAFVGATAITEEKGIKEIGLEHLGKAKKIVVNKNKTLIIPPVREEEKETNYQNRISAIKEQMKEDSNVKDRLARMTSSVVVLKAGAPTHAEMLYLKDKLDDAVCSTTAAVADGYLTGGGLSLKIAAKNVHERMNTEGSRIVSAACSAPYEQLLASSGMNPTQYESSLASVIDPTKVEKTALRNATSLASMFLSVDTVIVDIKEENKSK